ncbi:MAG: N-6 DNA methylase [Candidatus Shapirobacteria bacterium]
MTQSDFKNQVDNLMDILFGAGVASHATIIEQINYLVFLRSLSRKDDNAMILDPSAEKIFSGELRKYHWDNLLILNSDELFTNLEEVFRKLPEVSNDPTIKLLFRDAHVKVFDKPTLRRLVHEIEKMFSDLEKQSTSGHTDIFGDMYEYLLSKLSQAGTLGSFRTPRHIIKFIVDVIDPKKGETILDPACGTAGFLVAALKHLEEKYTSEEYKKLDKYPMDLLTPQERDFVYKYTFTGFDSDFDMFKFGLMNLYLHKLEHPNIKRQNTLVDTAGDRTKWDVILANPPFAGALDIDSVSEDLRMGTRSTELLFLRYMMDHLSPSGRAGVIVPEGVVFNSTNAHKKIRQMLVEDAGLWCVVSLPGGIFNPYAGVKTSILFFDKSLKNKVKDILFVKVENDGFDLGATKRPIDKNDLPTALMAINIYKKAIEKGKMADFDLLLDSNAVATNIENIKKLGYDLTADDHVTLVKAINKVLQSEIKENDYNLSTDRYKTIKRNDEIKWNMVELEEILDYEQPTKYIVKSVDYQDYYPTPVLTAGKTFILGYTNEKDGIYNKKIPVIIFDDFTSATKLVNFPFKVKSSAMKILQTKDDRADITFVYYMIQSIKFTTDQHKRLWLSEFSKYKIPLPPLEVQKQIVGELDGYQKIIDGAKQIIENWKPTFKINPTWKKIKLGDLCELKSGGTPSRNKKEYWNGDIAWYSSGELNDLYTTSSKEFITKNGLEKSNASIFPKESLLIGMYDTAAFKMSLLDREATFNQAICGVKPNNQVNLHFLYLYFMQNRDLYLSQRIGVRQKNLSKGFIENLEVPIPPMGTQKEIVEKTQMEREVINSLKKLIGLYQGKINQKIEEVWGD